MVSFQGTIPPGGRGEIELGVKTSGYRGRLRETAEVFTNDPERRKHGLMMELEVVPIFDFKPGRIYLRTPQGRPVEKTIRLTSRLKEPVEITGSGHDLGQSLEVKVTTVEKGRVFDLTVTAPGTKPARLAGLVRLDLQGAPVKSLAVGVFLEVTERAKGVPSR